MIHRICLLLKGCVTACSSRQCISRIQPLTWRLQNNVTRWLLLYVRTAVCLGAYRNLQTGWSTPRRPYILSAVFFLLVFWILLVAEAWALLLASLKSSCLKVQHEAAKAVWGVAFCSQQCKDAVIASGGLLHIGHQHSSSEALLIWSDGVA